MMVVDVLGDADGDESLDGLSGAESLSYVGGPDGHKGGGNAVGEDAANLIGTDGGRKRC